MTKGFTHLLKKQVPFNLDDTAQKDFDALKYVLVRASLLYPLDYQRDYFMYLVIFVTTNSMVLVQDDDIRNEHPIYYLIQNLNDAKIKYTHVENLALVVVQSI